MEDNRHIGYYLFREQKEQLLNRIAHKGMQDYSPTALYFFFIAVSTTFLVLLLLNYSYRNGATGFGTLLIIALVVLIPASDIAVSSINWLLVHIKPPSFLPKLELKEGIPKDAAAIVVMPALIAKGCNAVKLFMKLEEYYLANREENLYFALLGDYRDHDMEKAEGDPEIIEAAIEKVKELNKKYGSSEDKFFFSTEKGFFAVPKTDGWVGNEREVHCMNSMSCF